MPTSEVAMTLMKTLQESGIESRPVWKPMHQQPVFSKAETLLNGTADQIFSVGLCLPSSEIEHAQEVIAIWQKL